MTRAGRAESQPGHVVTRAGRAVTGTSHTATGTSRTATETSRTATEAGHTTPEADRTGHAPAAELDRLLADLRRVGRALDALAPLDDAALWAARCALDASALLLQAYHDASPETALEAVAASRASVVAATDAVLTSRERAR